MCFFPKNQIDNFFNLIKEKYPSSNENLFLYFEKYYLKNKRFKKEIQNYNKVILDNKQE